jgi:predicted glycoside hydrolase/deacetylase ChbG (UPF0249 family)
MGAAVGTAIMETPGVAGSPPPSVPSPTRRIVLHADDLGLSPAVSQGILQGFECGLLTSTSLLSNAPDAARALDAWRDLESRRAEGSLESRARRERLHDPDQPFDLGVHLNLTQGRPLTGSDYPAELLDPRGCFLGIFGLFRRLRRCSTATVAAIEKELACQLQFMIDHGHRPAHLNGHQYIEMLPPVSGIVQLFLERFHIPVVRVAWEPAWLRSFTWPGIRTTQWLLGGVKKLYAGRFRRRLIGGKVRFADAFFGTMTAGTTKMETIRRFLAAGQGCKVAEIGLHPGGPADNDPPSDAAWHDPLAELRQHEAEMVASAELEELLAVGGWGLGRLSGIL